MRIVGLRRWVAGPTNYSVAPSLLRPVGFDCCPSKDSVENDDIPEALKALSAPAFRLSGLGIIAVAAIVRWQLTIRAYMLPNSDQAIVGLMAHHILAGERPVFYWGQAYNGTLEA